MKYALLSSARTDNYSFSFPIFFWRQTRNVVRENNGQDASHATFDPSALRNWSNGLKLWIRRPSDSEIPIFRDLESLSFYERAILREQVRRFWFFSPWITKIFWFSFELDLPRVYKFVFDGFVIRRRSILANYDAYNVRKTVRKSPKIEHFKNKPPLFFPPPRYFERRDEEKKRGSSAKCKNVTSKITARVFAGGENLQINRPCRKTRGAGG